MLYRIGECGGILTSPRGIISSPLYPDNYPDNAQCTYLISQPIGKKILINFQSFDIETGCAYREAFTYDIQGCRGII